MTRRQRIDDLTTFAVPGQPALSPDGSRILYVLATTEDDRNVHSIWSVGSESGEPRQLTRGKADESPAWSPDGTSIAFLRAEDGPPQLWLLPVDGGEAEQLTTLSLGAGTPVWSPDGSKIAFSAATGEPGETDPIVTDRLDYQADGAGYLRTVRKHLHVLDLATKESKQVTDGDWHAGDPAWSADSAKLAFAAAKAPDADVKPRVPVYVLDLATASQELAGMSDGVSGAVTWSDDALLVVGMDGEPVGHVGLWRVPLDGGRIANLAAPLDRNVMQGGPGYPGALPQLGADGVVFCVRDRGCTHVYSVAVGGGTPRGVVTGAGRNITGMSVVGDKAAVVLSTPSSYGEIVAVDLTTGAESVRTGHGDSEAVLFTRTEREFTISDGTVVQGWLIRDPESEGPQPLLLDVHGGPHNAWNGAADEVHLYHQELVARGWTVLLVNPRGSDGYGEQFYKGGIGAWG
ncbi:MAG: serine hydrolase, partial [Kibdelosporangium sp.]